MQIKIAAPLGGDAIIEFDDNEEVYIEKFRLC